MSLTVCHIEWNFKFHVWRMSWGQGKHKCIIALLAETTRGELLWKSRWEYERKKAWEIRKKGNCCQSKAQSSPGKEGGRGNGRKGANRENTSKWKRENCSICFCKDRLFRVRIKIKIKKKALHSTSEDILWFSVHVWLHWCVCNPLKQAEQNSSNIYMFIFQMKAAGILLLFPNYVETYIYQAFNCRYQPTHVKITYNHKASPFIKHIVVLLEILSEWILRTA